MTYQTVSDDHALIRPIDKLAHHIALLRPSHWFKSIIAVPIGAVFLLNEATGPTLLSLLATIAMFVFASSAVYVINDLSDIERDRLHPTKRLRPLPSGLVSVAAAKLMLLVLLVAMAILSTQLPILVSVFVGIYLLSNIAYSMRLKHVPIAEMQIVAMGFALRTASGYLAFGVFPNELVVATVFAGSLLLTIGKRREELKSVEKSASHRPVLAHYSIGLLDAYLIVCAFMCLVLGLAAMRDIFEARDLTVLFFVSLPFVVFLLQRYLMLAFVGTSTSNPTRMLLTDRSIHRVMGVWGGVLLVGICLDALGVDATLMMQAL